MLELVNVNFPWTDFWSYLKLKKTRTATSTLYRNCFAMQPLREFTSKVLVSFWKISVEEFTCTKILGYRTGNLPARCFWKWVSLTNRQNPWKILEKEFYSYNLNVRRFSSNVLSKFLIWHKPNMSKFYFLPFIIVQFEGNPKYDTLPHTLIRGTFLQH